MYFNCLKYHNANFLLRSALLSPAMQSGCWHCIKKQCTWIAMILSWWCILYLPSWFMTVIVPSYYCSAQIKHANKEMLWLLLRVVANTCILLVLSYVRILSGLWNACRYVPCTWYFVGQCMMPLLVCLVASVCVWVYPGICDQKNLPA